MDLVCLKSGLCTLTKVFTVVADQILITANLLSSERLVGILLRGGRVSTLSASSTAPSYGSLFFLCILIEWKTIEKMTNMETKFWMPTATLLPCIAKLRACFFDTICSEKGQ